ncbi:MAG: glycosyltransferase family 4 protein [Chitinophagales bacterium]|nr:glycosyltransferase family 4 protein [Chitinophagales bacterium]
MMNVASVFPQGIPSVFVSHEMQAVRLEREAGLNSAGEQKNALLKKANAFAFHEALLAKNYSAVLTLTNVEKVFWEKHLPDKFVFNSPMGISLQPAVEKRPIQAEKLVYLSNGKHVPNVNGLLFFFKDVWPLLEDKLQIPFHITGHYSEEVHALAPKSDKIVWAGFVPNLSEFMANSISIVPILLGSGVRIKILESMALGAPVVSTSMGAEGIMAEQGRDILIADEPVRFAELILKLVADQDAYKQIRENALAQVAVHYQLEETIQQRVGIFKKLLTK